MAIMMTRLLEYGQEPPSGDAKADLAWALSTFRLSLADGKPAEIVSQLFMGSIGAAYNEKELRAAGVTHVLCLCESARLKYPEQLEYKRVPLSDNGSAESIVRLQQALADCLRFIHQALVSSPTHRCLVHCAQGKSRSAAVVIAYLMVRDGMSYQEALDLVRVSRPVAEPNAAFRAFLVQGAEAFGADAMQALADT